MKHIKFLAIAFVAMLTLASCNTDQEGPIYTPMSENVSLSTKTQGYQTQESSLEIPVRFVRSDASKEYTAHYNISTTADKVFSDPNNGEVTFKAGEGVAIVTIKAENMQKGTTYKAKLTLSDADIALKDTVTNNMLAESTISIMCDYEWEDAGTVTFTDATFAETPATVKGVKILHAVTDEFNLYKLVAPYNAIYGDEIGEANIQFYLNEDYSAKDLASAGKLDIFPNAGYKMYWDTKNYPDYNNFSNEGDIFVVNFLLTDDKDLFPGGYFSFKWDKWPGNK